MGPESVWVWRVLRGIALICFVLAVLVGFGVASIQHSDVFLALGLLFWCASNGIP